MCYTCSCIEFEYWDNAFRRNLPEGRAYNWYWETLDTIPERPINFSTGWREALIRADLSDDPDDRHMPQLLEMRSVQPPHADTEGQPLPPYFAANEHGRQQFNNIVKIQWTQYKHVRERIFAALTQMHEPQKALEWLQHINQLDTPEAQKRLGQLQELTAQLMQCFRYNKLDIDRARNDFLKRALIEKEQPGVQQYGAQHSFDAKRRQFFSPLTPTIGEEWWCARPECLHASAPESWYGGISRSSVVLEGIGCEYLHATKYKCAFCGTTFNQNAHITMTTNGEKPAKLLVIKPIDFKKPQAIQSERVTDFWGAQKTANGVLDPEDSFQLLATGFGDYNIEQFKIELMKQLMTLKSTSVEASVAELMATGERIAEYQDRFFKRECIDIHTDEMVRAANQSDARHIYSWPRESDWKRLDDDRFPHVNFPTPHENYEPQEIPDICWNKRDRAWPIRRGRQIRDLHNVGWMGEAEWVVVMSKVFWVEALTMSRI